MKSIKTRKKLKKPKPIKRDWNLTKIWEYRRANGFSMEEVAGMVGCTRQSIYLWENGGKISRIMGEKLVRAIGRRDCFKYGILVKP